MNSLHKGLEAYRRKDYKSALKEFTPLAEDGNVEAQFKLARMAYTGRGIAKDYNEAAKWAEKAAENNHSNAQLLLAALYFEGRGVAQSYATAAKWLHKAAKQNNADAQFRLGAMYEHDKSYEHDKNYVKAYMWYALSHINGDNAAKERRDDIAQKMTEKEIATAQDMLKNYFENDEKDKSA